MKFITNFRKTDLELYRQAIKNHPKYRLSIKENAVIVDHVLRPAYSSLWSDGYEGNIDEFWSTIRELRERQTRDLQITYEARNLVSCLTMPPVIQ